MGHWIDLLGSAVFGALAMFVVYRKSQGPTLDRLRAVNARLEASQAYLSQEVTKLQWRLAHEQELAHASCAGCKVRVHLRDCAERSSRMHCLDCWTKDHEEMAAKYPVSPSSRDDDWIFNGQELGDCDSCLNPVIVEGDGPNYCELCRSNAPGSPGV